MKISVCITHYNRADKLAPTLESLANQTLVPDEVFVWDDTSPVDPAPVVESFQGRFPRLVYHRNSSNLGMPGNLNAVLSQASGDYVANLHDADIFDPMLLEKWAKALDDHPSAGMVFCGYNCEEKEADTRQDVILNLPPISNGRDFFRNRLVGNLSCPIWGTNMVRKSVHDKLLPFDGRFRNWADVDYWMRICLEHDIGYVPEALISLDASDTPERRFSWYRVFVMNETYMINIRRHFGTDHVGLRKALDKQSNFLRKRYFRLMGRLWRWRDYPSIKSGVTLLPSVFSSRLHEEPQWFCEQVGPHR